MLESPMKIYVIKATYQATANILLIRAQNQASALKKAARLKEHRDVYVTFTLLDVRADDRIRGI